MQTKTFTIEAKDGLSKLDVTVNLRGTHNGEDYSDAIPGGTLTEEDPRFELSLLPTYLTRTSIADDWVITGRYGSVDILKTMEVNEAGEELKDALLRLYSEPWQASNLGTREQINAIRKVYDYNFPIPPYGFAMIILKKYGLEKVLINGETYAYGSRYLYWKLSDAGISTLSKLGFKTYSR